MYLIQYLEAGEKIAVRCNVYLTTRPIMIVLFQSTAICSITTSDTDMETLPLLHRYTLYMTV